MSLLKPLKIGLNTLKLLWQMFPITSRCTHPMNTLQSYTTEVFCWFDWHNLSQSWLPWLLHHSTLLGSSLLLTVFSHRSFLKSYCTPNSGVLLFPSNTSPLKRGYLLMNITYAFPPTLYLNLFVLVSTHFYLSKTSQLFIVQFFSKAFIHLLRIS